MIWIPPRAIGERGFAHEPCLVSLHATGGELALDRFSLDALPALRQVTLVFDARDVSLVPVRLPPMSGAKLRQALPNVVEDSLLQDPQSCALVLGPRRAGTEARTVAVIDRAWLEFVSGAFERRGIRSAPRFRGSSPRHGVRAVSPRRWCMTASRLNRARRGPGLVGRARAVRARARAGRCPGGRARSGLGAAGLGAVTVSEGRPDEETEADAASLDQDPNAEVVEPVPDVDPSPIGARAEAASARRIVAFGDDAGWRQPLERAAATLSMSASLVPLQVPDASTVAGYDLLAGRSDAGWRRRFADVDWRAWRVPAALAAGSLVVFLVGLNLHWGRLVQERNAIRAEMTQRFRESFPQAKVVVDPLLQMERQLAQMRARAGRSGPGDFVPMVARFSRAMGAKAPDALNGIEFRDGRLRVRFAEKLVASAAARTKLQQDCLRLGLKLQFETGANNTATVALN
ncbi:MAG: type II secretion system protein GspL [Burkholderiaceae bacterium]